MKKVKYEVNGPFGDFEVGTIVIGYIIVRGLDNFALLYFPKQVEYRERRKNRYKKSKISIDTIPLFCICKKEYGDKYWTDANADFINLSEEIDINKLSVLFNE